jgi:Zn-dependent protease with chaperone function
MTGDPESFISGMEKLAEINLADTTPHPLIEALFYSHPSLARRIASAAKFRKLELSATRSS